MSTSGFASAPFTVGQLNALVKIVGADNVPGILDGSLRIAVKQTDLLERITAVTVAGAQRFVAMYCFGAANVGWTGSNFDRLFRDKVEENVPETKLAVSRLERASLDAPILAELGDKAEVKLAYLFDLLKKQANGEDGVLLNNGYANIFHIRDSDGNLWAVSAYWESYKRYWSVEAHSVGNPSEWRDGRRVFSRDS